MTKFIHDQDRPIYYLPKQDKASVEIGRRNDHGGKVWPRARSEKWNGEAWMEISARDAEPRPGRPERLTAGDSVLEIDCQRKKGRKTVGETHRIKTGSLKWETVYESLADLPDNYAVFDISNPPGLTFHYQAVLTAEEIAEGCVRPDSVIGSYAVYWPQSGRIIRADGTERVNYETGKYCHIYRPEWVAANGERIWGKQTIVGSELRIAVPLPWIQSLGSAAFPLVLDPTFGYGSEGATNRSSNHCVCLIASAFTRTAISGDRVTGMSAYVDLVGAISRDIQMAVYSLPSGAGTSPGNWLIDPVNVTVTNADGLSWKHATGLEWDLTAGTVYGPALGSLSSTGLHNYRSDSGDANQSSLQYPDYTLSSPFVEYGKYDRKYSVYATYTEGATSKGRCVGGGVL